MTDLQDHPIFFFQIQIIVFLPVNFYHLFFQIKFILFYFFFHQKKLLFLQHKSCYYMYLFRLPICKSPLLLLFQKSVIIVINLLLKKKKNDLYASMGKNQKLCHNCPAVYLFSWEGEGNPYVSNPINTFKSSIVCLLTLNPYDALV